MTDQNHAFLLTSANYSTGPVRNDFHHHNDYEIIYITEGKIEATINNKIYEVPENHLLFISNLEKHSIHQLSGTYKRYWITLHTLAANSYIRNPDFLNILKNHNSSFCHYVNVTPLRQLLITLFEKTIACKPDSPYANDLVACYINELIINVFRLEPKRFLTTDFHIKNRILDIQKYLDANYYQDNIRIDEVCQMFFISNCYVSHQFKELTGYSPKRYLTLVRLKHASIMIHDTARPISEIAFSCGFSDINNFNKQFKQIYNCTPSEFRKLK